MDENRTAGVLKTVAGGIEAGVGEVTGDTRTKIEGKVTQGIGKVQSAVGSVIDQIGAAPLADRAANLAKQATAAGGKAAGVVQDAAQTVGAQAADIGGRVSDGARTLSQSVAHYVEDQPLTSVLIAAALGYTLARILHADRSRHVSVPRSASNFPPIAMPLGAV